MKQDNKKQLQAVSFTETVGGVSYKTEFGTIEDYINFLEFEEGLVQEYCSYNLNEGNDDNCCCDKQKAINSALQALKLPPTFLGQDNCCSGKNCIKDVKEVDITLQFTQEEVNTLTAILGFFNPCLGDDIYNIQDKLATYSDECVVEDMFPLIELVNEDGSSIKQPLQEEDGFYLYKECMNLKFNK